MGCFSPISSENAVPASAEIARYCVEQLEGSSHGHGFDCDHLSSSDRIYYGREARRGGLNKAEKKENIQ